MPKRRTLFDTNVVSQGTKRKKPPGFWEWLRQHDSVAIAFPTLVEIQMGIQKLPDGDENKTWLMDWFDNQLMRSDFIVPPMNVRVAETLAAMLLHKSLRGLWQEHPRQKEIKSKLDLHIAAVAIAHDLPLATFNIRDFKLIDKYFPLPELIDPTPRFHRTWPIAMRGPLTLGKRQSVLCPMAPHSSALGFSPAKDAVTYKQDLKPVERFLDHKELTERLRQQHTLDARNESSPQELAEFRFRFAKR